MPNHWHLVLSPREDGEMGRLLGWVTMTHTARHHAHYGSTGGGHLYQGRFKSFPIQSDEHFFVVCRYVERNALAAGLVERAEQWRWGSLYNWKHGGGTVPLSKWPLPRRAGWLERVNEALSPREQTQLRQAIDRSQPFGDEGWVESTARRYHLETTLRPRGRPRKFA
jgi:putative transposase